MSFRDEFKAFITKGNVVDLAIAVVIGGAFGKLVTAFVDGLVMPLVGHVLPAGGWQTWQVAGFHVGKILAASVDFFLVSLVIFVVLVKGLGSVTRARAEAPPPPSTKPCPMCLEPVALAARRCRHCTAQLD